MKKKVILFYKKLVALGGAEILLFKHYDSIIDKDLCCEIVTYSNGVEDYGNRNIVEVKNFLGLLFYLILNAKKVNIIGSSGHIQLFIASFFSFNTFNYLLHQPSTMSYNEYDKYAFNNLNKLDYLLNEFNKKKFRRLKKKISLINIFLLNIRFVLSKLSLKNAKNVFVLSNYAKEEKKILYNIDTIVASGAIDKLLPFKQKNISKSIKIISLSRLDKNKRIKLIINALKKINKKNIYLDIYGKGPEKERLQNQIDNLLLTDQVKLKGFIDEEGKKQIYSKYDFSISIDFADFRITSIESVNSSCPVIISNETSLDFIHKYDFLYFCEPNLSNLTKAILEMLDKKINWSYREKFLNNYLWKNYFDQINDICL